MGGGTSVGRGIADWLADVTGVVGTTVSAVLGTTTAAGSVLLDEAVLLDEPDGAGRTARVRAIAPDATNATPTPAVTTSATRVRSGRLRIVNAGEPVGWVMRGA